VSRASSCKLSSLGIDEPAGTHTQQVKQTNLAFEVLTKEHVELLMRRELEQPEWLPLPRRLLKSERL